MCLVKHKMDQVDKYSSATDTRKLRLPFIFYRCGLIFNFYCYSIIDSVWNLRSYSQQLFTSYPSFFSQLLLLMPFTICSIIIITTTIITIIILIINIVIIIINNIHDIIIIVTRLSLSESTVYRAIREAHKDKMTYEFMYDHFCRFH